MTNLTTEARRHGEESGDRGIARDRVIGAATDSCHDVKIGHAAAFCHPERPRVERGETRGSRRIPIIFAKAIRTLRAALREIFDESAYDRFLLRTHASRSVASYRAFTRERDAALLKKPRCC
jgi:hypothetical protein